MESRDVMQSADTPRRAAGAPVLSRALSTPSSAAPLSSACVILGVVGSAAMAQSDDPGAGGAADPTSESAGDACGAALAKQFDNPIASLISAPLPFNRDTGIGLKDADGVTPNVRALMLRELSNDESPQGETLR